MKREEVLLLVDRILKKINEEMNNWRDGPDYGDGVYNGLLMSKEIIKFEVATDENLNSWKGEKRK